MQFLVTDIRFDFTGDDDLTRDDMIDITDDALGIWEADDEDDLVDEITTATGWCIESLYFEHYLK